MPSKPYCPPEVAIIKKIREAFFPEYALISLIRTLNMLKTTAHPIRKRVFDAFRVPWMNEH